MVTLSTAEKALKSVYLGLVSSNLNMKANPFFAKVNASSNNIYGNEIVKAAPFGVNGGFSALAEDGQLPTASSAGIAQMKSSLKNLYGKIEISDKAIRASQSSSGAFVNLLNNEIESLIKTCSFHMARMLFGDGSGNLGTISSHLYIDEYATYTDVKNFAEGMPVEFLQSNGTTVSTNKVTSVDRVNKRVYFGTALLNNLATSYLTVLPGAYNKELTGLGAIFGNSANLYGLTRSSNKWLKPYSKTGVGQITDGIIQGVIDDLQEYADSDIDYITCSSDVRRYYQEYLQSFRRNIDYMELNGGYKAMSYAGIPVVADRFVPTGCMYILNSKDFNLYQLCDWTWLEGDDGKILKQNAGYATYSATVVKYAEMMCDHPSAQGVLKGINSGSGTDYTQVIATNTTNIATSASAIATNTNKFATDYATVNATSLETDEDEE